MKCDSLTLKVHSSMPCLRVSYRSVSLIALMVSVLMVAGLAPTVRADAALEASNPGDGDTVPAPLTQVELTFSGPAKLDENATRLLAGDGTDIPYAAVTSDAGKSWFLQPKTDVGGGPHGVIWEAKSADGHTVKGVLRFDVVDLLQESSTADEVAVDTRQTDEVAVDTAQTGTQGTNSPIIFILGVIAGLLLAAIATITFTRQRGKAAT